jgi:hypothetical protein
VKPTAARIDAALRARELAQDCLLRLEMLGLPAFKTAGPIRQVGGLEAIIAAGAGKSFFIECVVQPIRRTRAEVVRLRRFDANGYIRIAVLEDANELESQLRRHLPTHLTR